MKNKSWAIAAMAALAVAGAMIAAPTGSKNVFKTGAIKDEMFLVESVPDGRHFTVVWREREVKIGIRGIDVDDVSTPAGDESAAALRRQILGIKVLVRGAVDLGHGAYEADALIEGQNVAERLVSAGLARATGDGPLKKLELAAQNSGVGNWAAPAVEQPTADAQSAAMADTAAAK